ncbi:MAG: hypothetical protein MJD61_03635 [Proteobacteria bacterium]|nr:hypothetical protein [Pseudomonadota bacterium]
MMWRRLGAGLMAGLATALAGLFLASALGVPISQTGSSPGKTLFFASWLLLACVALISRRTRLVTGAYLAAAGLCFGASVLVTVHQVDALSRVHAGVLEVLAVLSAAGLTLTGVGLRMLRQPVAQDGSRGQSDP